MQGFRKEASCKNIIGKILGEKLKMEKKKKSNLGTLMGAAFLMATSAVGPGFLTQTANFTAEHKSVFAFVIICTILLDNTPVLIICCLQIRLLLRCLC